MGFKLKTRTMFPALVTVQAPLLLDKVGISYSFSIDTDALAQSVAAILTVGTASAADTGASGHKVPFLDVANTWSASQLISSGVFGYSTGAGGAVTQGTSKTTTVVLSKSCGAITMIGTGDIAADTTVSFTLTNTLIAATDVLVLNHLSGGTPGSLHLNAQCGAGSATINVRNVTPSNMVTPAPVISFVLIKGVAA